MAAFTYYLANKLLERSLGRTDYTFPTASYAALFTVAPTNNTAGTEVSGGSYARQQITWGPASSGAIGNSVGVNFPQATGNWGTVVDIGVFDALTNGNLLYFGALAGSQVINTGDTYSLPVGNLAVVLV